jgi:hypothetical protein
VGWSHLDTTASARLASGPSSLVAGSNVKRTSALAPESWWGNDSSWNRYAYVQNNPLRWVDPNGQDVEKAVATLKESASLSARTRAAIQPRHIHQIYSAEATRLSFFERHGVDRKTIGRGQLGEDAYTDVKDKLGGDFEAYAKSMGKDLSLSGNFKEDMADEDIEDFIVAGYFSIQVERASNNVHRSTQDALHFAAGMYHGGYKTLRAAQVAVGDDVNYPPVERHLRAGTKQQVDLADYMDEVTKE